MRRWLRHRLLKVRFVSEPGALRSELRFCGIKIGRSAYERIGRLLGRTENDWRDPSGDIGHV